MPEFTIGERRHTSAGNIYELKRFEGQHKVGVERVVAEPGEKLWDAGVIWYWSYCQWESLPLVGEKSDDPSFGIFLPAGVRVVGVRLVD